jgi:hypothetical protein
MLQLAFASVCVSVFLFLLVMTIKRPVRQTAPGTGIGTWAIIIILCISGGLLAAAAFYGVSHKVNTMYSGYVRQQTEIQSARLMNDLLSQPKYQDSLRLTRFEAKVFAQNGEDGIIAEIFNRIGMTSRNFVEFGSADGMENNTVFLLRQGWSGLWLDGDKDAIKRAQGYFAPEIKAGRLKADTAFITAENIEQLFASHDVPKEFDLLSIDIDRNDYHVWKAIQAYRPRVVVIEYNGIFSPGIDWVVDYKADAWWDGTCKFGASLTAYENLGRQKGYSLVGCTVAGVNAFFVRNDLVQNKFCAPYTARNHYEPPRYWMTWGGHPRVP